MPVSIVLCLIIPICVFFFVQASQSRSQTPSSISSSTPQPQSKQTKVKQFVDKMTSTESKKIDTLLAEFFFACNVPFVACESIYFKNLLKALRPAYTPPNRKKLSGPFLDMVNNKIGRRNDDLIAKMDNQTSLIVDGWTNSNANRHYLVAMLATAENQKIFLDSYDISESREMSANLAEIVQKSVDLTKSKYGTEVYSVVSDNARNMTSMGNMIQPELWFTTCNSHTGNLLAKDVIAVPKYKAIL